MAAKSRIKWWVKETNVPATRQRAKTPPWIVTAFSADAANAQLVF
jgi:hypothetical protein